MMDDIQEFFDNKSLSVIDPNDIKTITNDQFKDRKKVREEPNSLIAEKCLLAALMNEKDGSVWELVCHLRESDFYYPRHSIIFSAINRLVDTETPIDIVTTAEALNNLGKLSEVGELKYLTNLIIQSPSTANAKQYATIILENSFRRNVIQIGRDLSESGSRAKTQSPEKILQEIDKRLISLQRYIEDGPNGKLNIFNYDKNFDFAAVESDPWIIENLIMRGMFTICVAPGGVGKSIHNLSLAISIATGNDFLGLGVYETCNVLSINNEDPKRIIDRRVGGILDFNNIPTEHIEGKFFGLSGYGDSFTVAMTNKDGSVYQAPKVKAMIDFIIENEIGCVWIDPFISTHDVNENDNSSIEQVVNQYRHIAEVTNCAIVIIHHTGKINGDSEFHAGNIDSARGASSLPRSSRFGYTLCQMSQETMDKMGIDKEVGRHLYRQDGSKANYSAGDRETRWFKRQSYTVQDGISSVGVPVVFDMRPHKIKSIQQSEDKKAVKKGLTTSQFVEKLNEFWIENEIKGTQIQQKLIENDLALFLGVKTRTLSNYFLGIPSDKKQPITIRHGKDFTGFYRFKKTGPAWYLCRM